MKGPDKAEIVYMAAVIDGEGCLTIGAQSGNRHYQPVAYVKQANRSWLEDFQSIWGGAIVDAFDKSPRWALKWQWEIWGHNMVNLLEAVRPYLRLKRAQADLLLELQRRIDHGPGRSGKRLPREELEVRRELYKKCRLLNRKGPRGDQLGLPEPSPQLQLLKEQ